MTGKITGLGQEVFLSVVWQSESLYGDNALFQSILD
jgi:hypothetical protein